jgi:hypothetical protein
MFLRVGRKIINTDQIIKAELKYLKPISEIDPNDPEVTLTFAAFDGGANEMFKETLYGRNATHLWHTLNQLSHDVERDLPSSDE